MPNEIKKRVLIVDDEPDAADMLTTLLIAMGYDARTTYDARQAIEVAAEFQPLVAVLDIRMPGIDGYEAAERLRRADPGIKLLALTGASADNDAELARRAGFDAYLIKSLAAGDIAQALEQLTS
jgi:CheY-like chemotaxis protein